MEWFIALLLVTVLLVAGLGIAHQIYGVPYMGRRRNGELVNKRKKKVDPTVDFFAWKARRRLEAHRKWDAEFHGLLNDDQLIVYNGKLVTINEADQLYFIEEIERKRKWSGRT